MQCHRHLLYMSDIAYLKSNKPHKFGSFDVDKSQSNIHTDHCLVGNYWQRHRVCKWTHHYCIGDNQTMRLNMEDMNSNLRSILLNRKCMQCRLHLPYMSDIAYLKSNKPHKFGSFDVDKSQSNIHTDHCLVGNYWHRHRVCKWTHHYCIGDNQTMRLNKEGKQIHYYKIQWSRNCILDSQTRQYMLNKVDRLKNMSHKSESTDFDSNLLSKCIGFLRLTYVDWSHKEYMQNQ
jgi:hypothetical protein